MQAHLHEVCCHVLLLLIADGHPVHLEQSGRRLTLQLLFEQHAVAQRKTATAAIQGEGWKQKWVGVTCAATRKAVGQG